MPLKNPTRQRNIYLVDDDEDDRMIFAEALFEIDNKVMLTYAHDGYQLMELLYMQPNHLPDIIFMDINMPRKDGLKCLEEIRNNDGFKKLFVIILSTSSDPSIIDKAFNLGATFYAVKPSTFENLKSFIKQVLQIDWFVLEKNNLQFRLI